jgi:hypothetical protein
MREGIGSLFHEKRKKYNTVIIEMHLKRRVKKDGRPKSNKTRRSPISH